MKRKRDIDAEVARLLDMPSTQVAMVSACFLRTLLHEIVDNGEALVDGFGSFLLREQRTVAIDTLTPGRFKKGERGTAKKVQSRKFRVWFKKSAKFKRAIETAHGMENVMEKYGVDEGVEDQEKLEKQASAGCPECGQKLARQGAVLLCPTHGTEPFEKKDAR